jgi:hypothetical protein
MQNSGTPAMDTFNNHYGQCTFYLAKTSIAFLHIPKNASTSIRWLARSPRWIRSAPISQVEYDRICVILRDPEERFLSALNMYLAGRPSPENMCSIDHSGIDTTDVHFLPQHKFLHGLDRSKIDFFYQENDVVSAIRKYYGISGDQENQNHTKLKIVTEVNFDVIERIYAHDYDLIESVEFKN